MGKEFINLKSELIKCCGSEKWADEMLKNCQFNSEEQLYQTSDKIWYSLDKTDWLEAFSHHPKIGDQNSLKEKFSSTKHLAENEQSGVNSASELTLFELSKYNEDYEKKFGFIFIVCASGKTADEMLSLIKERILNNPEDEIKIAMKEQNKITNLRLNKTLNKFI